MIYLLSLQKEANSSLNELAHSIGSSYPLKGCSSAEPFSVSLDLIKIVKKLTQFELHSLNFLLQLFENLTLILFVPFLSHKPVLPVPEQNIEGCQGTINTGDILL